MRIFPLATIQANAFQVSACSLLQGKVEFPDGNHLNSAKRQQAGHERLGAYDDHIPQSDPIHDVLYHSAQL